MNRTETRYCILPSFNPVTIVYVDGLPASIGRLHTLSEREATLAIRAAREVVPTVPVIATMTFDRTPRGFFTIMGTDVERAAERAEREAREAERAAEEAARNEERLQRWRVRYAHYQHRRSKTCNANCSTSYSPTLPCSARRTRSSWR